MPAPVSIGLVQRPPHAPDFNDRCTVCCYCFGFTTIRARSPRRVTSAAPPFSSRRRMPVARKARAGSESWPHWRRDAAFRAET
jgi:hypothetical protein